MKTGYLFIFLAGLFVLGCREEEPDLPSFESRVTEAVEGLRSELTAPADGWRLEYQPTPSSGTFLILLKFSPNGDVNIKSDVPDNNGEFFDQTITYRIDNALSLELIFETFAVFHHLFELEQASFGAEFEFAYKGKEGNNLRFESISDFNFPTQIIFEPAGPTDESEFARNVSENMVKFKKPNPQIFGTINYTQQVIISDKNVSMFWTIDLDQRNLIVEYAGIGVTRDEVIANNRVNINHFTKFTYGNGGIILEDPVSFSIGGTSTTVELLPLSNYSETGPDLCVATGNDVEPLFSGQNSTLGSVSVINSLLSNRGADFVPSVYSVNAFFMFNEAGESLLDNGIIGQLLPDVSAFLFLYGVDLAPPNENLPKYSMGFITEDGEFYLREYAPTNTSVNLVPITLLDQYYYSATPPAGTEQALKDITDEIFSGGEIFAFDEPVDGFKLFRLYNPCNRYEFFLVQ